MNRALVLGIAMFFAIVGLSLVGGQSEAVAGHGCNGSQCDGGHHGRARCNGHHGRDRCHGRGHHRRDRCNGRGHHRNRCNGGHHGGCNGGYEGAKVAAPVQKGDAVPAAPAQKGPAQAPQQK
jgi:hypothetical protein